jgi:hypothetical protein
MNDQQPRVYEISGGEILVWLDPSGIICLRTRNAYDDPVELAEHEATELAELLLRLVKEQQE